MANISEYLAAILAARKGNQVRSSIHDAISMINDVSEKFMTIGTAVTSESSSTDGYFESSLYLNSETSILWKCVKDGTSLKWESMGEFKGGKGDDGDFISSWKGHYLSSETYEIGDIVYDGSIPSSDQEMYVGGVYVCIASCKGKTPYKDNDYWETIANNGTNIVIKEKYCLTESSTQPESGWAETKPEYESGKYLWTQVQFKKVSNGGNSSTFSYFCDYIGKDGNAVIDDTSTASDKVWSASKTNAISAKLSQYEDDGFLPKNLCYPCEESSALEGIKVAKNTDGTFTFSGTSTKTSATTYVIGKVDLKNGKTYKIASSPSGGGTSTHRVDLRTSASSVYNNAIDVGSGYTFTSTEDVTVYVYARFGGSYAIASPITIKPFITEDTSDTYSTYVPYCDSNVALTTRIANNIENGFLQKNLFNELNPSAISKASIDADGTISTSQYDYKVVYIPIEGGNKYTISADDSRQIVYSVFTSVPSVGGKGSARTVTSTPFTITTSATDKYIAIRCDYVTTNAQYIFGHKLQIEKGESATNYVPYAESNVAITSTIATNTKEGYLLNNLADVAWEQGTFGATSGATYSASKQDSTVRLRVANTIPLTSGKTYYLSCNSDYNFMLGYYNASGVCTGSEAWTTSLTIVADSNKSSIAILIKKVAGGTLTTNDVPSVDMIVSDSKSNKTITDEIATQKYSITSTTVGTPNRIYAFKHNGCVSVSCNMNVPTITKNTNTVLFSVPTDIKPSALTDFIANLGGTTYTMRGFIDTSGNIQINCPIDSTNAVIVFNFTYAL